MRCLQGRFPVDFDGRKRVVMDPHEFRRAGKLGSFQRIIDSHGKKIADREHGEPQFRHVADQLHVQGKGCIP
jgi:hypothetical protein